MSRSPRVLIVDDDPVVLKVLARLLSRLGAEVVACEDPILALEMFEQAPGNFDHVLSDQDMPGLSGQQMLAKMRAVREDLTVALCSGRPIVEYPDCCYLMSKPVTFEELGRLLNWFQQAQR